MLPLMLLTGACYVAGFVQSQRPLTLGLRPLHGASFDGSGATMAKDVWGGAGLLSSRAFLKGETIISVPLSMCLMARRDGIVQGLQGQSDLMFEVAGDLRDPVSDEEAAQGRTWDMQLAYALLDATSGFSLAGPFWDQYFGALPKPHAVTLPSTFSDAELRECQDDAVYAQAKAQQARLARFAGSALDGQDWHRASIGSQWSCVGPFAWAFAMVRSRCFQVSADWFAVVPVIEIANHALVSNAEFAVVGGEGSMEEGCCVLRATRDVAPGEEVLISYDANTETGYGNKRLFQQYGFVLEGGNPNDDDCINWGEASLSAASSDDTDSSSREGQAMSHVDKAIDRLVDAAISILADPSNPVEKERVESVSRSIGTRIRRRAVQQVDDDDELLARLLDDVTAMEKAFPTTLGEDLDILKKLSQSEQQLAEGMRRVAKDAALRFRIEKKKNLKTARELLECSRGD